jgi:hypothetical protein
MSATTPRMPPNAGLARSIITFIIWQPFSQALSEIAAVLLVLA